MRTYRFKIFGHDYETKIVSRDEEEVVISVNGQEYEVFLEPSKQKLMAKATPKITRPIAIPTESTKITALPTEVKGAGLVRSPLPGLVVRTIVKAGEAVKAGQTVLILEAMKMQNNIPAGSDGTVETIMVKDGDSVLEGQELVLIKP